MNKKTYTAGNIAIEDIKPGDTHYEYEYGCCIKTTVLTVPTFRNGVWSWTSVTTSGKQINYTIDPEYSYYGPKLYDYEAYVGCKIIE